MRSNTDVSSEAHALAGGGSADAGSGMPGVTLAVLILISTTTPIAMNMYLPALPAIQADFGTSTTVMQLTLSLFLAATALGQLVAGPLSDIFGRRPVLTCGLSLFVGASLLCALAPTAPVLIVARVLQGIGGCTGLVLSRAIVRDICGTATAASMIGYVTMGIAVAPLITPTIGGLMYEWGSWQIIFLFMAVTGLIGLVASLTHLPETHAPSSRTGVFARWRREVRELLRLRAFWSLSLTLAALCIAFFTFVSGGTVVAVEVYGLGAAQYGLFFVFMVSGYILGNFVTARYSRRIGITPMIVTGNAIALVGILGAAVLALADFSHPVALFGPMFVVGLGNGFALPNCVAGCVSVRPDLAGTASGLAGSFQIGSGALASLSVGLLIDTGWWADERWPVLILMVLGGILALSLALTIDPKRLE